MNDTINYKDAIETISTHIVSDENKEKQKKNKGIYVTSAARVLALLFDKTVREVTVDLNQLVGEKGNFNRIPGEDIKQSTSRPYDDFETFDEY